MKLLVVIIFICFGSFSIKAQNSREVYMDAKESYGRGDFQETIQLAIQVKKQLGKTNPKIESLCKSSN